MFDVITIGTATRDLFLQSPAFKPMRDPKHLRKIGFKTGEAQCFPFGSKVDVGSLTFSPGGCAPNVAVTFGRQGLKTGAFFTAGKDHIADLIVKDLKKEKIAPIPIFSKKTTAYSVILLSQTGERTILTFNGGRENIKEIPISRMRAKAVYIGPGHIPFDVIAKIIKHLRKSNTFIAINPSKRYIEMGMKKLRPLLNMVDVVILNREEASYLSGAEFGDERKIFGKFDEIVKGIAVMTDGPRGVLVSDGGKIYRAGIYKEKKIADRTGAGDAFGGGFVAGLLKISNFSAKGGSASGRQFPRLRRGFGGQAISNFSEKAVKYAIRLGSANATSVVERIGAQAGILTERQFKTDSRWKKLKITIKNL